MRYRVAFAKRIKSDESDSGMHPSVELDQNLADGIVAEKVFVEQIESDAQHGQEDLDEDDDFLGSAAPEVWDYDVIDARAAEFEEAIKNSDLVLEYDVVDEGETGTDDVSGNPLKEGTVFPPDGPSDVANPPVSRTAEPESDEGGATPSGTLDDLAVTTINDPNLGLTNTKKRADPRLGSKHGSYRNPGELQQQSPPSKSLHSRHGN